MKKFLNLHKKISDNSNSKYKPNINKKCCEINPKHLSIIQQANHRKFKDITPFLKNYSKK